MPPDHAKDNVVFTEGAIIGYTRDFAHVRPGNFGGTIKSSDDFVLGISYLQETIDTYGKGRRIFNCSDGALIPGATPMRANDIRIDASDHQKKEDTQIIHQCTVSLAREQFKFYWNDELLRCAIDRYCKSSTQVLGNPMAYTDNLYMSAFMALSRRSPNYESNRTETLDEKIDDIVARLFSGTIVMALYAIRYFLSCPSDEKTAAVLRKHIACNMTEMISQMRADAIALLDKPSDIPPAKAEGGWEKEDFIQEATYTWGDTNLNAPCPCGSGKRYKHCHGSIA